MKKYEKIFDELNDNPMKKIDELIKQAKELRENEISKQKSKTTKRDSRCK